MKKIYLLSGLPGSGKSTYVKSKLDDKTAWISRDNIRFSLVSESEEYFSKEKEVFKVFIKEIKNAIKDENIANIYIDATHLNQISRNKVLDKIIWGIRDELNIIYFNIPLKTCIERNNKRSGREKVPEEVIRNMAKSFTIPSSNEKYHYNNIIVIEEERPV